MAERGMPSSRPFIITRTPLRISFVGGGTDLAEFYQHESGAVLSMAIDRYVYVTVKRHSELFFEPIRINYSKSEQVDRIDEVKNDIARECLRFLDIDLPIYISTVGDVPASTGLGGSGAFAVGLLHALHAYRGDRVAAAQLAEEASTIEIEVLGQPIGKQDQYAAAFGGLNLYRFNPDGGVTVEHQQAPSGTLAELFDSMLLFWTGHQRDASKVLSEQRANVEAKRVHLSRMRDQAIELHGSLRRGAIGVAGLGQMLHEGWCLKRQLASRITNSQIDHWYEAAIAAGAEGGKLCGAGGGGFLLFIVPPAKQDSVRRALADLVELQVGPDLRGSQLMIPFNG
jgi:D-glycero-alpha-D-manno-heptose-7-phosphate kinase